MPSSQSLCLFLVLFIASTSTHAYTIEVGGSKGWTLQPTEDYQTWSARMRFSVNDTLHFKYNKDADSVLEVSKDDYDNCNANNPITKLDDGASAFTLDTSGPFYFITGNKTHCENGQKIHLIVLTVRNGQPPAAASTPPPPVPPPPPATPDSPSAPITVSPAPGASISIMSPPPMTSTTPADLNAPPPTEPSSAIPAFNAASTVSFVIFMLTLAGIIGSP